MKKYLDYVHPSNYITIGYQLILLCITLLLISIFIYKPFVEFHPVGPKPVITASIRERAFTPIVVDVGMHITDFLKFDTVKNEFILNALIWFDYDKKIVKQDEINAFAFTKGEILQKSDPIFSQSNGKTRALYFTRIQFSTILDFRRFPLDDHRIFLNLVNQKVPSDKLIYRARTENYVISKTLFLSGWKFVGHTVENGYASIQLNDKESLLQHKTIFSLDVSKSDVRQLMLIMLPLLFLFYLGLFAFSIRDVNIAMTLPLASISGLFAYSFVIQVLAPSVGYMMMSDYFFFYFLVSLFTIFLIKALAVIPETHLSRTTLKTIEGTTVLLLQIGLIIVAYVLFDVRGI